jgi:signal transduction histidine kinase
VSERELDLTDGDGEPPARPSWLMAELADLVTVIRGHAILLESALPPADEHRADLTALIAAAERAAAITTRLVAEARAGQGPSPN